MLRRCHARAVRILEPHAMILKHLHICANVFLFFRRQAVPPFFELVGEFDLTCHPIHNALDGIPLSRIVPQLQLPAENAVSCSSPPPRVERLSLAALLTPRETLPGCEDTLSQSLVLYQRVNGCDSQAAADRCIAPADRYKNGDSHDDCEEDIDFARCGRQRASRFLTAFA